ncbi:unnamed protein product [Urochloa decumbens]|uniref:BTB domain-containing protein n=1 Tax=Urochloa decumbens TaxID=240449 RepID=A0ABC9BR60_9POAL
MEGRALDSAFYEFRVYYEQAKHLAVGATIHSDAFSAGGHMWRGWSQFIAVPHLEENNVKNGRICLVCAIMLVNDSSIPMPPSDLGDHLGALLDSADGTDVSFFIGGQTFQAHRTVLAARSLVFRAELLGSMAESTMSSITLQDIAPETFKLMLQFIYTDAFPEDHELGDPAMRIKTLMLLLAAADRYALGRLKLLCAKRLWDNMALTSVAGTLAFADKHNCPELKEKCLDFIVTSGTRVFLTDGYIGLGVKHPHLIAELQQKIGGMIQSPNGPYV